MKALAASIPKNLKAVHETGSEDRWNNFQEKPFATHGAGDGCGCSSKSSAPKFTVGKMNATSAFFLIALILIQNIEVANFIWTDPPFRLSFSMLPLRPAQKLTP